MWVGSDHVWSAFKITDTPFDGRLCCATHHVQFADVICKEYTGATDKTNDADISGTFERQTIARLGYRERFIKWVKQRVNPLMTDMHKQPLQIGCALHLETEA